MRLLLVAFLLTTTVSAQTLLIRDVNVVDPRTGTVKVGSIRISKGMVDTVIFQEIPPVTTPREDTQWVAVEMDPPIVIEGKGLWIIPGLHDMHVHSFGNTAPGGVMDMTGTMKAAKVMLYAGVTGFLDLFSAEDAILSLRDRQRRTGNIMSDIYASGPILTCSGGHGTEYGIPTRIINTPADAQREIMSLAMKKPDVIKIVYDHAFSRRPTIDKPTMEAAVKGAASLGIKTVIHIGTWQDAREAILAGANCITHVHDEPIPADLVQLMRERNVYEIPTLCVQSELVNISAEPLLLDSPLLAQTTSAKVIDAYRDTSKYDKGTRAFRAYTSKGLPEVMANVKAMHGGGVQLMAGTDVGNLGVFQGYSLHRELELLVRAGLTPFEALASSTTTAGTFLGTNVGFRRGDVANFVLLNASPIEDIRNTQKINAVVYRGRAVDRGELLNPSAVQWKSKVLDEFISNSAVSTSGREWVTDIDTMWGGKSTMKVVFENGVMHVAGKATPAGQRPALAGMSLPLADDAPVDLSAYTGIRVKVTSATGPVQLKLVTKSITNYDYHAVTIPSIDVPRTLEFPFAAFKQQWSAPVAWTGKDVGSIALWVSTFGTPAEFDFTIDAIELY